MFLTSTLIACGQPNANVAGDAVNGETLQSASPLQMISGTKQVDVTSAVDRAQIASKSAEDALTDARAALSLLADAKGNIALNVITALFTKKTTVNRGGLLAPLTNRLQGAFDAFFVKADVVKSNINAARLTLAVANAQLDLSDPAQVLLAQQIVAQMAAIDATEATLKSGMKALANKVDQASQGLTKLVALGTSFIPIPGLNFVASFLIDTFVFGDLTSLLESVKLRLTAL